MGDKGYSGLAPAIEETKREWLTQIADGDDPLTGFVALRDEKSRIVSSQGYRWTAYPPGAGINLRRGENRARPPEAA